jgi:metal-responsive CopG/Arc/MetJ family transcriptional regulator
MKMSTAKVAITLDENILKQLDRLVKNRVFENRSRAIQEAVREKLSRLERDRLARECAKLDRKFEQAMAEEGLSVEVEEWPEY